MSERIGVALPDWTDASAVAEWMRANGEQLRRGAIVLPRRALPPPAWRRLLVLVLLLLLLLETTSASSSQTTRT
jgi:hypothetical protein